MLHPEQVGQAAEIGVRRPVVRHPVPQAECSGLVVVLPDQRGQAQTGQRGEADRRPVSDLGEFGDGPVLLRRQRRIRSGRGQRRGVGVLLRGEIERRHRVGPRVLTIEEILPAADDDRRRGQNGQPARRQAAGTPPGLLGPQVGVDFMEDIVDHANLELRPASAFRPHVGGGGP